MFNKQGFTVFGVLIAKHMELGNKILSIIGKISKVVPSNLVVHVTSSMIHNCSPKSTELQTTIKKQGQI